MTPREMMAEAGVPLPPHVEHIGGNVHLHQWARCAGITHGALKGRVRRATPFNAITYVRLARLLPALPEICASQPGELPAIAWRHGYYTDGQVSQICYKMFGVRPSQIRGRDWREIVRAKFGAAA